MTDESRMNPEVDQDDDEISLLDLAIALGEEKLTLFLIPTITTILSLVYVFVATPIYTAKTVVLPPQQQQSGASAALAQLGALAGMAGAAAGIKTADETYVGLLKSDTLRDELVQKFDLKTRYQVEKNVDARKALESNSVISSDKKSGFLTIEVDDKDPKFAADLANAYVKSLESVLGRIAVTEAQQRRAFFEQQVSKTSTELGRAEQSFKQDREKGGMQVTTVLAEVSVKSSAELRAQIAAREVELAALHRFATAENPDVQRVASTLSALRTQLAQVERGGASGNTSNEAGQAAVKSYRDVKTQQAILEVLIKQLEMAKVDEAKEGPLLQQVDVAQAPERKSKPKRALVVMIAALAGLFLGVLIAFIRRALKNAQKDPKSKGQLSALRQAWRLR